MQHCLLLLPVQHCSLLVEAADAALFASAAGGALFAAGWCGIVCSTAAAAGLVVAALFDVLSSWRVFVLACSIVGCG
jgi:hypothetical protein